MGLCGLAQALCAFLRGFAVSGTAQPLMKFVERLRLCEDFTLNSGAISRFAVTHAVISATGLDLISIFFASNGRRGWWTVCVTQIHNFLGELEKFSNSSQV